MSNWSRPAILGSLKIENLDVTEGFNSGVELSGGFVSFEYFESLTSPHITAKIHFVDTGSAILAGATQDLQERLGTLESSVPTLKGKELHITINHPSDSGGGSTPNLEFNEDRPFIISDIITKVRGSKVDLIGLQLSSKYALDNLLSDRQVDEKYGASGNEKISNIVTKILLDKFQVSSLSITPSRNTKIVEGKGRDPFSVILTLAKETIPEVPANAQPGYVFYESLSGFNFRGIDDLINQQSSFAYTNADVATFCEASNLRILDYQVISSMKSMKSSFLSGEKTEHIKIDLFSQEITYEISNISLPYKLGTETVELENLYFSDNEFSKTVIDLINTGNSSVGINTVKNNDQSFWRTQSSFRYNSIFSRRINIVVPCNLGLRAGQILQCSFPKKTDQPELGMSDEKISGSYLIMALRHEFTSDGKTGSLTHLTLIRDTDGMYQLTGE